MRKIVVLTLFALGAASIHAANFSVFEGNRQAQIVFAEGVVDEEVQAYQDLADYLQRATGRTFPIYSEDRHVARIKSPSVRRIYVGNVKILPRRDARALRGLDRDAFIIHVTEREIFLVGARPWSTYWAVCQFLEDYVGVRWLIPGELGEDVPHVESLSIPVSRQIFTPQILSRAWSGATYAGIWNLRQRIHSRYAFHHNLFRIFDPDEYYDQHPEWYPLRSGKRYRPSSADDQSWQPCFASLSSVKHAASVAREAWKADPELESFSFGCNDGQGWCECDGCAAMDLKSEPLEGFDGTYSGRYFTWLNAVAKELEETDPDRLLGCLAYSTYILPPEQIGVHRNIIPYLTSNRADYFDSEFRATDKRLLSRWGKVAHQMGIYEYAYGMGFAIPRIYNHLFQDAIQHAVSNGVTGFYAEVYPNWGLDGPKLYVMSRLLWNPDLDVDALVSDWCTRMFRESAVPMAAYFDLCETAWRKQETGHGHWAYRLAADPRQFEVFPPSTVAECTAVLDHAAALAVDDVVKERIAFFRKAWDVCALLAGNYWAAREVQTVIDSGAPLPAVAEALRTAAERLAGTDVDAYIDAKIGDDPIAFYPPKASWIVPLKSGASATALRWTASKISRMAIDDGLKANTISAEDLRSRVREKIAEVFGSEGSDAYRVYVDQIRQLAGKVATVKRVSAVPVVDGILDDTFWTTADSLTGFTQWGDVSASAYETKALLGHDGENLYVALDCRQKTDALKVTASPRDGTTWKDDSVEIFLNPSTDEFPYVQFIVNAAGAFFDQWGKNETQTYAERLAANFNCRWQTHVNASGWTAELVLPLAEFGITPAAGTLVRLNVVRNVQAPGAEEASAWFSSVRTHADPLSRGWLVFE